MKTAKTKLGLGIVLSSFFLGGWAWAGPLVLYDNFNAELINPDKWFGTASGSNPNQMREDARLILLKRLQLLSRSYSITDTDEGGSFSGESLHFINPDSVTAVKATIQVLGSQLQGCGANDKTSRVRARFAGYFFNTTNTPTSGSPVNDVFATIALIRQAGATDPPNTLRVSADISLCRDATCFLVNVLGSADLGTARIGQQVTLRLEWDNINHQFIAQRDNQREVRIPYTVRDNSPPGAKSKRLEVAQWLANCTAQPRPTSFMSAFFDNVYVNAAAMPAATSVNGADPIILEGTSASPPDDL